MVRSILSVASFCIFSLVACSSSNGSSGGGTSSNKSISTLDVSPNPCVVGHASSQQMTAKATYADGTSADVTDAVTWSVSDDNATITSSGNLVGTNIGTVTVSATLDGVTGTAGCGVT
jgi:hypothetical protein